jgi:hypothetical protein
MTPVSRFISTTLSARKPTTRRIIQLLTERYHHAKSFINNTLAIHNTDTFMTRVNIFSLLYQWFTAENAIPTNLSWYTSIIVEKELQLEWD